MIKNKENTNITIMHNTNRKAGLILLIIMCSAGLFFGCGKKSEQDIEQPNITGIPDNEITPTPIIVPTTVPTTAPTDAAQADQTQEDESQGDVDGVTVPDTLNVINNGGLYITYKGEVYYRQYNADSYEATGLWGYYNATINTNKSMMRLKADGTVEEAFEDTGEGDIYIQNDRMFLQKPDENLATIIYSVNLNGRDYKELGTGTIEGIDGATGTLIAMMVDENGRNQLSVINGSTTESGQLNLATPCAQVLAVKDGFIYYKGEVLYAESECGKIKLCRVAIDGTREKLLVETSADLYLSGYTYGMEIPCLQFVGDTLYFSYGGYAGTGYFYQGGCIARVKIDGSDFEYLAGMESYNDGTKYATASELFYVVNENGKNILFFSKSSDNQNTPYAFDLDTMEIASTDFPIHAEGIPFEQGGGVSMYQKGSSTMTTLVPKVDYNTLGFDEKIDYYYTVKNIQLCDSWVYYKLEANESCPEASIGWRDGYKRIKTQVIREEINGASKEILYEY